MFPSIKAGGAKIREGALKERPREGERETPGKHIHFRLIVRQCCQSCYDTRTQVHTQAYMQKHTHNICSSAALWFGRTLESHPTQTHKVIAHTHTHTHSDYPAHMGVKSSMWNPNQNNNNLACRAGSPRDRSHGLPLFTGGHDTESMWEGG